MVRWFGLALVVCLGTSGTAPGQDDRYQLSAEDSVVGVGQQVEVSVTLDSVSGAAGAPLGLQGWSYGMCHDPGFVDLVSVVDGATTSTVNGGGLPDFSLLNEDPIPGTGFVVGIVIDFFGVEKLSPGTGYQLNRATYQGLVAGVTSLDFCNTLDTPPVETLVVQDGGASAIPSQQSGQVSIVPVVDDRYTLRLSEGVVTVGGAYSIFVYLDSEPGILGDPAPLDGWVYGVCHDPTVVTVQQVLEGSTTTTVNGGNPPGFVGIEEAPPQGNGFGMGVVIDLFGIHKLDPGVGYELSETVYQALEVGGTSLDFCDTIGNPPFGLYVIEAGASIVPAQESSTLAVGEVRFSLSAQGMYDARTGEGEILTTVLLGNDTVDDKLLAGFSGGIAHDPLLLVPFSAEPLPNLTSLQGGLGPDLLQISLAPDGGAGVTFRVVFDLFQQAAIPFSPGNTQLIDFDYAILPDVLQGNIDGFTTTLYWSESLGGTIPITNVVLLEGGAPAPAATADAVISLTPNVSPFRRADCNADGSFDLSDPILVLGALFAGESIPPCPDACDANDDGAIDLSDGLYLLLELFGLVSVFPEPYAACGADQTADDLGCPIFTGCP